MRGDDEPNDFDRARFDESMELAMSQLALQIEPDDDREIGS